MPCRLQRVYAAQYSAEQLAFLERKKSSGGSVAPAAPVSSQADTGRHAGRAALCMACALEQ